MTSNADDPSPPERDRAASRRWIIGISLSLVFGTFGAVMALLNYMERNPTKGSSARPAVKPGASSPAAPAVPSEGPEPAKGKGNDKK